MIATEPALMRRVPRSTCRARRWLICRPRPMALQQKSGGLIEGQLDEAEFFLCGLRDVRGGRRGAMLRAAAADDDPNRPIVLSFRSAVEPMTSWPGGFGQDERRARPADHDRNRTPAAAARSARARSRTRAGRYTIILGYRTWPWVPILQKCRLRSTQGFCADRLDCVGAGAATGA